MENAKIADRAVSAYKAFSELLICLDSHNQTGKLREQEFKREFDRFTMWTSNIGAHKRGQSSLDFRLRDAAHIRDAVLSMLGDLQELITDSTSTWNILKSAYLHRRSDHIVPGHERCHRV